MKYWGYLAAKLVFGVAIAWAVLGVIRAVYPPPPPFLYARPEPFGHDLNFTFVMLGYFLFCVCLLYIIILDQRYRCRTCLRRLRMPIARGSWTHILFGPPKTEYICPYGHGTLLVPELHVSGNNPPDWQPHEDMWKELIALDEKK
jgi:hypothetical protein